MYRDGVRTLTHWALGLLLAAAAAGCGEDGTNSSKPAAPADPGPPAAAEAPAPAKPEAKPSTEDLVTRGKRVYNVNCIACHRRDPNLDGGLGPAIAGSSIELLRARVLEGTYPPGYKPKRDTRLMIPLPHLAPDIPALAAYLAQSVKSQ